MSFQDSLISIKDADLRNTVIEAYGLIFETKAYHGTGSHFGEFNTPIVWYALDKELAKEYAGDDGRIVESDIDYHNPVRYYNSSQSKTVGDLLGEAVSQSTAKQVPQRAIEIYRSLVNKYGKTPMEIYKYFDAEPRLLAEFYMLLGFDAIESAEGGSFKGTKVYPTVGLFK